MEIAAQHIESQEQAPAERSLNRPVDLLRYRSWQGEARGPLAGVFAIARVSLRLLFRRKFFWVLYSLALIIFLMFFFGQYLLAWAESQVGDGTVRVGIVNTNPGKLISLFRDRLRLNGSPYTFRAFFWWQGYMVMIVLAFAGALLVGNDFHHRSLPFYLSKPLGRWHYLLGKCLAVAVLVNLTTTLPALVLFVQYGLLDSWDYFIADGWTVGVEPFAVVLPINPLVPGILAYGLVMTVCLSLMLVEVATWVRKTVPLIMTWTTLFFFLRLLASALVNGLHYDARWRLLDVWNSMYLVGCTCLGLEPEAIRPTPQPEVWEAAVVLGGVCLICLVYLNRRIRAVEVVA
ncbi:MAG: ABC transporter permease [Gemmataceae bacterium]